MTQLTLFTAQRPTWLAFSADHDEEDAARRFLARFGCPPEQIIDHPVVGPPGRQVALPQLWLGPVPESSPGSRTGEEVA